MTDCGEEFHVELPDQPPDLSNPRAAKALGALVKSLAQAAPDVAVLAPEKRAVAGVLRSVPERARSLPLAAVAAPCGPYDGEDISAALAAFDRALAAAS